MLKKCSSRSLAQSRTIRVANSKSTCYQFCTSRLFCLAQWQVSESVPRWSKSGRNFLGGLAHYSCLNLLLWAEPDCSD